MNEIFHACLTSPDYLLGALKHIDTCLFNRVELSEYELEIAELIILEGYRLKGEANVQD